MDTSSPLRSLFARYVTGQIEEPLWTKFMQALDDTEGQPSERMALAAFLNDAVRDQTVSICLGTQRPGVLADVLSLAPVPVGAPA